MKASLHKGTDKCTDSPKPSLQSMDVDENADDNLDRSLAMLDKSSWAFIGGFGFL